MIGCGECPDLSLYPPLMQDGTRRNWEAKKAVYAKSQFYVSTPCEWLMEEAKQSMLWAGAVGNRVIRYGVDTERFCPGEEAGLRNDIGASPDTIVFLFVGVGAARSSYKDLSTLQAAFEVVGKGEALPPVIGLAIGGDTEERRAVGRSTFVQVPFCSDEERMAGYYRAADVYVHSSRAETSPISILEAMSSGLPVVATSVGGVPEQIGGRADAGILVPSGDAAAMAKAMIDLARDASLRREMGARARREACEHYSKEKQVQAYLDWFGEILEEEKT
jgi:glycosyltransferase involved in cell wall biosynthesis